MFPPLHNGILKTQNYIMPRGNNNNDYRFGPILPFLAGVLVTTPFIFLSKNNQPYYNPYPPQYPMYPPQYMPYPPTYPIIYR